MLYKVYIFFTTKQKGQYHSKKQVLENTIFISKEAKSNKLSRARTSTFESMFIVFCEDLQKYNDNSAKNLLKQIKTFDFIGSFYAYYDLIKIQQILTSIVRFKIWTCSSCLQDLNNTLTSTEFVKWTGNISEPIHLKF